MDMPLSLEEAIEKFIAYLKSLGRSNNTIVAYQGDLTQLVEFLKGETIGSVDQVNSDHIEQFKKNDLFQCIATYQI